MKRKNVVIIGAGFGGLTAALSFAELSREKENDLFTVTVIDKRAHQLFTPDLYEIASASASIASAQELENAVCIDVKQALLPYPHLRFVQGEVTAVDRTAQIVSVNGTQIPYDYLVMAVGSTAFDYGIPGVREHAVTFKSIDDAIEIRHRLLASLDTKPTTHIVFCGAGPAGVEVAAEVAHAFRAYIKNRKLKVTIVDGEPRILGAFHEKVSIQATKRLKRLGIRVESGCFIEAIEGAHIRTKSKDIVDADIVVWTGGVQSAPLVTKLGLPINKRGQLIVEPTFQCAEDERVFAIGDSAQVPVNISAHPEQLQQVPSDADYRSSNDQAELQVTFAPQTAHEAVEQGRLVARNVLRAEIGGHLQGYAVSYMLYVIALGGKNGIMIFPGGTIIGGFIGWVARKVIDFRHFHHMLPFREANVFWYNGLRTMLKND